LTLFHRAAEPALHSLTARRRPLYGFRPGGRFKQAQTAYQ